MTQPLDPAKLLALALYKLGEPMSFTKELYNAMMPVNVVLTEDATTVTMEIRSAEILIGTVDNDEVTVVV